MFSDSTRTPTSIEVRQAAFTVAFTVTSWPMTTGCMKFIRSMAAVTALCPECRTAAIPATSSQRCMITPPCTLPAMLASPGPIQRLRIEPEADGGRGSTRPGSLGLSYGLSRMKEARHARTWRSHVDGDQVQDLEDPRSRGGSLGDAGLRVSEAGRAAAERQEGDRGRRHVQEAAADAVVEARAAGRQARHPGAPGDLAGPRGSGPRRARAQDRRANRAPVARPAGHRARAA